MARVRSGFARRDFRVPAALGALYVIWGAVYLGFTVMVQTIPPLLGTGVRLSIAAVLLLVYLRWSRGRAGLGLSRRQLGSVLIIGTLIFGGVGLITASQTEVPSGLAAVVVASVPLLTVVLRRLTGERISLGTAIATSVGFVGIGALVLPGGTSGGLSVEGLLLVVGGSATWALGGFLFPKLKLPADPQVTNTYAMLFGGVLWLIVGGLLEGPALDLGAISTSSAVAFALLLVFDALIAFSAYAWLLKNAPISKVATYAYVNPLIAVGLGAVVLGEPITVLTFVGGLLILFSVTAAVRSERDPAVRPGHRAQSSKVVVD